MRTSPLNEGPAPPRILIFAERPGDLYRVGRTARTLARHGLRAEYLDPLALSRVAADRPTPLWLVRAGAWPAPPEGPSFPPSSATGRPLCALGRVRLAPHASPEAQRWAALLAETGGALSPEALGRLETLASAYLDAPLADEFFRRLSDGEDLTAALFAAASRGRLVHFSPLDVYDDPGFRVVQVVTSLQRGGAERVVLDLVSELPRCGVQVRVVTLGRPTRGAFVAPPGTVDLSAHPSDRDDRLAAARVAEHFAADVVHGHLIDREDARQLARHGFPVVLTAHNMRPGWPEGLGEIETSEAALVVGCAWAVESELRAAGVGVPVRTVWNGIDPAPYAPTPELRARAQEVRRTLGAGPDDFLLLAVANPRPQKRLHLLPAVLAETRAEFLRRGITRTPRLLLAGEPSPINLGAAVAVAQVRAEALRHGLEAAVHWLGPVADVAPLLAATDVLVSASAYEGLSLAHLEALAAGRPVVATDAGGTAELVRDHPALTVLPLGAPARQFAAVLASLAEAPAKEPVPLAGHFHRTCMAEQYARLYPRAVARAARRRPGRGLWLVTNNFSTGGVQSSARRLLTTLQAEGVAVRAAVLQEEPDDPTPGRKRLIAAGVPVVALPPPDAIDAADAVARLLERIDADPPRAVLFWNALAVYKVLLADALLDVQVFDVSPGEMYYTALERYFARPRPGLPYRTGADYGACLTGVIVKYHAEATQAAALLGAPVHVIPNGVPLGPEPEERKDNYPLVLGTLARISPQKKLEELLAALCLAAPRLPPHLLRIAGGVESGSEEYYDRLRSEAAGLAVEWVGEVEDTAAWLRGLDLFVMVSEPAGCPNASLEALAAGLPLVVTDVGGAAEQVEDGVTGRLVPRGDVAALAEAVVKLSGDPVLRRQYGRAGRRRAEKRFSVERMAADYRRVCLG